MIEKRSPVRHYFNYVIGLIGGVTGIGLALDLSDRGGVWNLLGTVVLVALALWLLENAIIGWYEFSHMRWRFHCQICHSEKTRGCEFLGTSEKVAQLLRDSHMRNVHHHYIPED